MRFKFVVPSFFRGDDIQYYKTIKVTDNHQIPRKYRGQDVIFALRDLSYKHWKNTLYIFKDIPKTNKKFKSKYSMIEHKTFTTSRPLKFVYES